MSDTYLNTDDTACFLGLAKQTLARWRVEGSGPPYRKFGSRVAYRRADLEAFVERNAFEHTSQYTERGRRAIHRALDPSRTPRQQPTKKLGTAVVLRGKPGIGKTLLRKAVGRLLGGRSGLPQLGGWCSPRKNGAPLALNNLAGRLLHPLLDHAGLPHVRLYDLRHTHVTLMLAAGAPVHEVAARVGHASAKMTLNVYAHALPHHGENAVRTFSEFIVREAARPLSQATPNGRRLSGTDSVESNH